MCIIINILLVTMFYSVKVPTHVLKEMNLMFRLWTFEWETSLTYSFTLLFGRLVSLGLICDEDVEHLSLTEPLQELCHAVGGSVMNKLLLLQHNNQNLYFLSQAVASERSLTRKLNKKGKLINLVSYNFKNKNQI